MRIPITMLAGILLLAFWSRPTYAHKEWVHQHMVNQSWYLLESKYGEITTFRNRVGLNFYGYYSNSAPWDLGYVNVGAWREDGDDVVYGYSWPSTTNTHFWNADGGWTAMNYLLLNNWENAYQKAREILFTGHSINIKKEEYDPIIGTDVSHIYISYSSLINFYITGQCTYLGYTLQGSPIIYTTYSQATMPIADARKIAAQLLGHVAHLLGDMSVPAHVHVDAHPCQSSDADGYELYMGGNSWDITSCEDPQTVFPAQNYTASTASAQGGIPTVIGMNDEDAIRYLFYTLNQVTSIFPSEAASGNNLLPNGTNSLIDQRMAVWGGAQTWSTVTHQAIAGETFNLSIRCVASLFEWFCTRINACGQVSVYNLFEDKYDLGTYFSSGNLFLDDELVTSGTSSFVDEGPHYYTPESPYYSDHETKFSHWQNDETLVDLPFASTDYSDKIATHEVTYDANFKYTNTDCANLSSSFEFKDPWNYRKSVFGPGVSSLYTDYTSYNADNANGYSFMNSTGIATYFGQDRELQYNGVILHKYPQYGYPHYSLRVPLYMTPLNNQGPAVLRQIWTTSSPLSKGDLILQEVDGLNGADLGYGYPSNEIPCQKRIYDVCFDSPNSEVIAKYKSHLHSSKNSGPVGYDECSTCPTSQRKLIDDDNGDYHLVYESNGGIWYTKTFGTTHDKWTPEMRLNAWTENSSFPSIVIGGDNIFITWNTSGAIVYTRSYGSTNPSFSAPIVAFSDGILSSHPVIEYSVEGNLFVLVYEKDASVKISTWSTAPSGDLLEEVEEPMCSSPDFPAITLAGDRDYYIIWNAGGNIQYVRVETYVQSGIFKYSYYTPASVPMLPSTPDSPVSITSYDDWSKNQFGVICFVAETDYYGPRMSQLVRLYSNSIWGQLDVFSSSDNDLYSPMVSDAYSGGSLRITSNESVNGFVLNKYDGNANTWYREQQSPSTGSGSDYYPSLMMHALPSTQQLAIGYPSDVLFGISAIDVSGDNLSKKSDKMTNSLHLLISDMSDTSELSVSNIKIESDQNESFLSWIDDVDSVQLNGRNSIQRHMRTELHTVDNGEEFSMSYRYDCGSSVTVGNIYIRVKIAANDSVLANIGPLFGNVTSRNASNLNIDMSQYVGTEIYFEVDYSSYNNSIANYSLVREWSNERNLFNKMSERSGIEITSEDREFIDELRISTYPNPAQTITILKVSAALSNRTVDIAIYDTRGETVKSVGNRSVQAGDLYLPIDLSGMRPGIYIVSVSCGELSAKTKISVF